MALTKIRNYYYDSLNKLMSN